MVKLARQQEPSPEFEPVAVPGCAITVQVAVKGAKRYLERGKWV
jgi:hypothetical protein